MKLLSGSSNPQLAASIAQRLGVELLPADLSTFPNGEHRVRITDRVRGENVAIVQSFSEPVDTHIIETLLMIDALERLGARHVNLILPWMGYSLQDKVFREGEPIAAKVVANLISHAYVKRAILLDLHNSSTPGFFSIPTQHVSAQPLFFEFSQQHFQADLQAGQLVVASPDFGGLKRARVFADQLQVDLVNIDKHRNYSTGEVTAVQVQGGSVEHKTVLILDDAIVSGGTVIEAARVLKDEGASQVHFLATHSLLVQGAAQKLAESEIDSIITTNSISHDYLPKKFTVLDAGELFAQELRDWV